MMYGLEGALKRQWVRHSGHLLTAAALSLLTFACKETEAPVIQPIEECKPEQTRPRRCGLNGSGTQQQVCNDGRWADEGACDDPDVCVFGRISSRPCGPDDSGLMATYCESGQWVDDGICEGANVCSEGDTRPQNCGFNDNGSRIEVCANGQWDDSAVCDDPDECRNTTVRPLPCGGLNGNAIQRQLCEDGQWGQTGACNDPDVCTNGEPRVVSCGGLNGNATQAEVCENGAWEQAGSCNDPDECRNGLTQPRDCGGLNGRARQPFLCTDGSWTENGTCDDPDVCLDNDTDIQNCGGFNGNAELERTCITGQWTSGPCNDPDICENGTSTTQVCGQQSLGEKELVCTNGDWDDANDCVLRAVSMDASSHHACAISLLGVVVCWGLNANGELGILPPQSEYFPTPIDINTQDIITQVVTGAEHTCALTLNGDIFCWGSDALSQTGERGTAPNHQPTQITSLDGFVDPNIAYLVAGRGHTCALGETHVYCWGDNQYGQLGVPMSVPTDIAVQVPFIDEDEFAIDLAAGYDHTCAVMHDGTVKCWGLNADGQLGDGTTVDSEETTVQDIGVNTPGAMLVSAGEAHTCIVDEDESVMCWGDNLQGQLGDTTTVSSPVPVLSDYTPDPSDSVAGLNASSHASCLSRLSGDIWCWGDNSHGGVGVDPATPIVTQPTVAFTLDDMPLGMSFRGETSCVVSPDQHILCWGSNDNVLLGRGVNEPSTHIAMPVLYP